MRIYLSGPIAGLALGEAKERFEAASILVKHTGHVPLSPFDIDPWVNCSCENGHVRWGHEWSCYLRADIQAMLSCDGIFMLPDWEKSHGARLELNVAAATGLAVFMTVESLHGRSV